ncbi:hypothetical protein [Natronomonas sp.]|uniref:hypothetical protein n=1 Tax=Natronomonas sp. TaxID=2184060 RepID=UPI002FC2B0A5
MTDPELSRRELLAGLGGIGVAGAASGAGTYALFSDRSDFDGRTRASGLALDIECDGSESCANTADGVSFRFDGLDRGDERSISFRVTVRQNPARVWMATDCPEGTALEDALEIELRGSDGTEVSGRLSEVRRRLHTGTRVDGGSGCTAVDSPVRFELRASLPAEVDTSVAGSEASLTLAFFAEQCRHAGDGGDRNPFRTRRPCRKPSSDPDRGRGNDDDRENDSDDDSPDSNDDDSPESDGESEGTGEPEEESNPPETPDTDGEVSTADAPEDEPEPEKPASTPDGEASSDEDPNSGESSDEAPSDENTDVDESTDQNTTSGANQ